MSEITIQSVDTDIEQLETYSAVSSIEVSIARDVAPKDHIQTGDISNTDGSYLHSLDTSSFISMTAELTTGTSQTILQSDQFANLNAEDVIGSLVTIKDANTSTYNGYIALVTEYDEVNKAVTIGSFYNSSGVAQAITLSAEDEVYLTFEKELEGAVIRSTSSDNPSFSETTVPISSTLAGSDNLNKIELNTLFTNGTGTKSTTAPITNYTKDALIGATLTFDSTTATTALQSETRTIIDVLEDHQGSGSVYLVFDEDLPVHAVAATDEYTISFSEITATIKEVDFASGVITTNENFLSAMGNRDFDIHPVIDGTYQKEVQIYSSDTLTDIRDRINLANTGVEASIINDGSGSNPYKLSMTSENSGLNGAVNVSSDISNFGIKLATKAQDAKVIVGDVSGSSSVISSNTNTIVDGIAGVTLDLKSASTERVSLTIDNDKEGITEQTSTLVEEINSLLKVATDLTALEIEVESTDEDGNVFKETQKGILFGDSTVRSLINNVKFLLTSIVEGVPSGEINSYADIGIILNSSGTEFEFDETVLDAKLNSDFEQVMNLMTYKPNLVPNAGISYSNDFLLENYDINHMRNGETRKSGFSETGNGTNGVKLQAGSDSKYLTLSLSEERDLYGFRFHHYVPDDLTARYSVSAADAGSASIAANGTGSILTDTTGLAESKNFIEDQLVGATITIGTFSSEIESYSDGSLTLVDNISAATPSSGYTITTKTGDTLDFSYNPVLEYLDPSTGSYKTYQSFSNIGDGSLSVVFPGGIRTDSVRLRYDLNTGDSLDFTESGYYARLMEFEVLDSQGLGQQFNRTFNGFTDAFTGSLQLANQTLETQNTSYATQIARLNESIENKQIQLIKEFQNLEVVVSQMNNQSHFFQSQLNGLPKAFSYRGNNK